MTDGWFHTGDAGYFKNGQLFLTERIKDLFKTSNGKYVAPQALKRSWSLTVISTTRLPIADHKFVSLIVPVYGKEYAKEKGIEYKDMTELLQHPKIVLFRAGSNFSKICDETNQTFHFTPEPFSMERGIDYTLKLKRAVVAKRIIVSR